MVNVSWWRHQIETYSALLALWAWKIHRSPVNSPHKGRWRGALIFFLSVPEQKCSVNNREAGDLRRHRAHHDVIVMVSMRSQQCSIFAKCWHITELLYSIISDAFHFSPWIASISYSSALICVWNGLSQLTFTEISNHWQATSTVVLSFCQLLWRVGSFNNSFSRVQGFTRSCAICLLNRVWINAFPRRTSCLISQRCCVSTVVVCYAKCTKQ